MLQVAAPIVLKWDGVVPFELVALPRNSGGRESTSTRLQSRANFPGKGPKRKKDLLLFFWEEEEEEEEEFT